MTDGIKIGGAGIDALVGDMKKGLEDLVQRKYLLENFSWRVAQLRKYFKTLEDEFAFEADPMRVHGKTPTDTTNLSAPPS